MGIRPPILALIVATGGTCVLALEMLGTRLLAPRFGLTFELWAAMLSATLLALSLGYRIGAGVSRSLAPGGFLTKLLALSALWCLALPWLKIPVLAATGGWDARLGALLAAFTLFAPPLAALGAISPIAVQLAATRWESAGRAAGGVLAMSTLGSVAGALLTGFVLIPVLGVRALTLLLAALLGLVWAAALLGRR
ncbi:MAG: fused MFS/spermidine synthase [Candidatus Eremiobacterota bacterium]